MTVGAIISGIVAFIKAIPILDGWLQLIIAEWMQHQTDVTLAAISDAAALAARAQTDDERYKASQAWQKALQRPREGK